MPSLEGVRLKMMRAGEHLDALNSEVDSLLADLYKNGVVKHVEPNSGDHVWVVDAAPALTTHVSVIAGDFAHCLRSALDHIVYELATQERPLTEFPIYLKPGPGRDGFHEAGIAKIWSLPIEAKVLIERLQPYEGWNGLKDKAHPLWLVHDFDRIDKHRRLLAAPSATIAKGEVQARIPKPGEGGYELNIRSQWIINASGNSKHGDEVARLTDPGPDSGIENLYLKFPFQIAIDEEGIAPGPIGSQLREMYDFVANEVVAPFEPFFQ
jgi:hypothetical protein